MPHINLSGITGGRHFALEVLSKGKNCRSCSGHPHSTVNVANAVTQGCLPQCLKFDTMDRCDRTQEPCLGHNKEVLGVTKPKYEETKPMIQLRANVAATQQTIALPWRQPVNSTRGASNIANRAVVDRVIDPMQEIEQGKSTSWIIELNLKGCHLH